MNPIAVDTGSPFIARYDNVISPQICNLIVEAVCKQIPSQNKQPDGSFLPWHNNETIGMVRLEDKEIQKIIDCHRFIMTQLVFEKYGVYAYPHFSDLVMWRKGMHMGKHKDDGYDGPSQEQFRPRKFSSIIYLNDNYTGGETVIEQPGKEDYISVPKKGSMVIFKSNDECIHGVNEVLEGTRFTLATWFSTDIQYCETVNGFIDPNYVKIL